MSKIKMSIITAGVLSLSGCFWQTIDGVDIYYAEKLCAEKGSTVNYMSEYFSGQAGVWCKGDPTEWDLNSYKNTVLERGVGDE